MWIIKLRISCYASGRSIYVLSCLLILCILSIGSANGQISDTAQINQQIREAEKVLKTDPAAAKSLVDKSILQSQKSNYRNGLGLAYVVKALMAKENSDSVGSRRFFKDAKEIFEEDELWDQLVEAWRKEAFMLNKMGSYDEAIRHYMSGLEIAKQHGMERSVAKILSGLAGVLRLKGEYARALNYAFEAMQIQEKIGDSQGLTFTYDRIGVIYKILRNNKKALEYHSKALNLRRKLESSKSADFGYSNMVIGDNYYEMDSITQAGKYFSESLKWYQKAHDNEGISYCYTHLGMVENALGNYQRSLDYYYKAKKIFEGSDDPRGVLNTLGYISNILFEQNRLDEAENTALQALKISTEIQSTSHIMNSQKLLYLVYRAKNNIQKALYFHELYSDSKDSLYSRERSNAIADLAQNYEKEKNELVRLQNENNFKAKLRERNLLIVLIACILLAGILFITYLFRVNKSQSEANIKLSSLNQKVESQKSLLVKSEHDLKLANSYLEYKISERTKDLQLSKEQLEQYVYLASHDLKQPLRSISGFSKLLERNLKSKANLDENSAEYLQYITGGIQFMHKLIEDIIDYSRIHTKTDDEVSLVKISDLIGKVLNNLHEVIERNEVMVQKNIEDLEIEVNSEKIEQVFEQLLSNAIKYRREDVRCVIKINARLELNMIRFEIIDNGTGISDEYHDKIFDPFLQLQGKYIHGGSGMGLSICKRIVEQHGGKIWVESKENEGTKMIFLLPTLKAK